jgi:hypothetical protein
MRTYLASLVVVGALAGAAGCTVQTESPAPAPAPAPPDGTVTIDWTVDGTTDPSHCQQGSAASIQITVDYTNGGSAGTYEQSCGAFSTSITLAPGDYDATAVLVDGAGNPRTTSIAINPFTIHGNDNLNIPIDFPSSSFL